MSLDKALSRLTDASASQEFYSMLDEEVDRLTGEFGDRFEVEAAKDMGVDLSVARRAKSVPHMKFDPDIDCLINSLEQMPSEPVLKPKA